MAHKQRHSGSGTEAQRHIGGRGTEAETKRYIGRDAVAHRQRHSGTEAETKRQRHSGRDTEDET